MLIKTEYVSEDYHALKLDKHTVQTVYEDIFKFNST